MEKPFEMDLAGKLLIAMPALADPRFEASVVLVCAHSPEGSMGLIINKPMPDVPFSKLLEQLNIPVARKSREIRVHFGGPVERSRGFVLHSDDYSAQDGTMTIVGGYGMTATQDVLTALGRGEGPKTAFLALGYAGWGPGQLEAEVARNDWLTTEAKAELVFSDTAAEKWGDALRGMGVNPLALSSVAGRA